MTRDEAIKRLVEMQYIQEAWATGLVDSLIILGVFKVGDPDPGKKALEAYEEALQAQKALDDVRHPL